MEMPNETKMNIAFGDGKASIADENVIQLTNQIETKTNITFGDGKISTVDENVIRLIKQLESQIIDPKPLPNFYDFSKFVDRYSDIFLKFYTYLIINHKKSQSSIYQDLFVLFCLDEKRNGFFIEFIDADNSESSNTSMLQEKFNWTGAILKPNSQTNEILEKRSNGCKLINGDFKSNLNNTISSAYDVFIKYFKSSQIDYMSIDADGSELEILKNYDFEKFAPTIITIKQYFNNKQTELDVLLAQKNYVRFFKDHTNSDAWYVLQF